MSTLIRSEILKISVALFFTTEAFGYVDPGSGHMLIQALGVAFFGLLFYLKQIVAFAKRVVSRDKK
ncbi:MAG: hypothetical protein H6617_05250 [Bdellovibrionaceae bacterium]|nr:hypothetical protein [Bdellovibrionales bacterium]MCB9254071.1 hypothetical protein [Pseudobdellovibrionaceae bacterium]